MDLPYSLGGSRALNGGSSPEIKKSRDLKGGVWFWFCFFGARKILNKNLKQNLKIWRVIDLLQKTMAACK